MCPRTFAMAIAACLLVGPAAVAQQDPQKLVTEGLKLQRQGQLDEALHSYEQAVSLKPDLFDAQLALGKALDLRLDFNAADDHLGKAIELAKGDERPLGLGAMAVSFAFQRKPRDAARYYQRLIDLYMEAKDLNGAGETADALGRVYLECGDNANARQWYESGYETARRQPNLPGPLLDLWRLRWEHAQGRIAARSGDRAAAARHVQAVKNIVAKQGEIGAQWAVYYELEGYVAFYKQDYRGAIASLLRADQADAFVLGLLGQAYERVQDPANARICYERVMGILQHDLQVAFSRPNAAERLKLLARK